MQDSKQIEAIAERVVGEVLSRHVAELRHEMVRQVIAALPAGAGSDGAGASSLLETAIAALQQVTAQADVLNVLLDYACRFSRRVGLFVVRGGSGATIWQARGFADDQGLVNFNLNLSGGVVTRVMQERVPVAAGLDFDQAFLAKVGNAAGGNAVLLPLVLRDRVSAMLYADCGLEGGKLDVAALRVLVRSAGMWLEVLSLRKSAGQAYSETPSAMPQSPPEKAAAASSAVTAAPQSAVAVAVAVDSRSEAEWNPEEREVHTRAQRFARLLVDEIKLYNQAKVAEGRHHHDLYDRLKDDIDKSRASYEKRYGTTPAAAANYFTKELVRILADNDSSLLGANFSG